MHLLTVPLNSRTPHIAGTVIAVIFSGLMQSSIAQQSSSQLPRGNDDAQRAQQAEQNQQLQEQQRQDQAMTQRINDLQTLEPRSREARREREVLRQQILENFQRRYQTLRADAEQLVQLTSELQGNLDSSQSAGFSRKMLAETAKIQKLAHEIQTTMTGRKLAGMKSAIEHDGVAAALVSLSDRRQLLIQEINKSSNLAGNLKSAMAQYLAKDNEHTVSVQALKSSRETQLAPQLVSIMLISMRLEYLAASIRAEVRHPSTVAAHSR
jgi:hypothetical protein